MDKDQYRIALDLNQIIWDGGNLKAQKENVTAQGEIQTKQTDVDMYNIRERINNLYFGILLIEDKIRLNQDLQTLLQSNYDKLESMLQNGTAMQADVNAIRAEYLKTNQQLTELTSMRQSFQQILTLFIGKQVTANTTLLKPNATLPISLENLRPELQMFDAQLQQTEAQRRLLNSEVRPRLSLFAQGFYGYPGYNMFEDMFNHDFSLNGLVGVRLSWNISKLYTHKNNKRKLVLAQNQIENAREVFLFNNQLQSTQEQEAIERYRKMMSEDDEIIRLRTSVRQAAEAKLKHGVIDVNNLLQEITRENQARTNQSSHEIEMLKHFYELRHTVNQ